MHSAYRQATKRLSEVLPETIYWMTTRELESWLGFSNATRKRDQSVLQALGLISKQVTGQGGYPRDILEIWWEFRQLQKQTSRYFAITNICPIWEEINREQHRQTSDQRRDESAA
ncbi:MAG: hypothetical protein AAFO04_05450 [Cyanobacteria bacterium J06592_8]